MNTNTNSLLMLTAAGLSMTGCTAVNNQPHTSNTNKVNHTLIQTHALQPNINRQAYYHPQYQRSHQKAMHTYQVNRHFDIRAHELRAIGDKIFYNENGGDIKNLVHWNHNENFASMGIGHFTWYPPGRAQRHGNTFPQMLSFLESKGVQLPYWLKKAKTRGAPWQSRAQLQRSKHHPQIKELQQLLYDTRALQAEFILNRAERAIPKLIKAAPNRYKQRVHQNLQALMSTHSGRYALVDYINFKGEGLSMTGGYRGQNWGALQVLIAMHPVRYSRSASNEFANAAQYILKRRAENSPGQQDMRWMAGWTKRVNTYRHIV